MIIDLLLFAAAWLVQGYFAWILLETIWKVYKKEYPTYDAVYILVSMVCLFFGCCIQLFAFRISITGIYFVMNSSMQLLYNMLNFVFAIYFSFFMLRQINFPKPIEKTMMLIMQMALMLYILGIPCVLSSSCLNEVFSISTFSGLFLQFGQVIRFDNLLNYINTWYIVLFFLSFIIFSISKKFTYKNGPRTFTTFVSFLTYLFIMMFLQFISLTRMSPFNIELVTFLMLAYRGIFVSTINKKVFITDDIVAKKPKKGKQCQCGRHPS